jgi:peptidoglycan/xylan/chitin deacetylase (PgdA/CDA1 family)
MSRPRTRLGRALPPSVTDAIRVAVAAAHALRLTLSARRPGLVLLYHRIEARPGDPARELVPAVSAKEFARQLRWLTRLFRVVPAASILDAAGARPRGRRIPVAITFDDEWPTHTTLAQPALRRAGATATFFLTGAHLQGRAPFWWESLQHAVDAGMALDGIVRDGDIFEQAVAITEADTGTRAQVTERLRAIAGPQTRSGMPPEDIRAVAEHDEVGFHTLRHDTLTALSAGDLDAAMRDGRAELESAAGAPLRLIAYPHGAAGEREARAAQRAGFALGFTAEPEACGPDADPFLIGRVEPGQLPIGAFLRVVTGVLGRG